MRTTIKELQKVIKKEAKSLRETAKQEKLSTDLGATSLENKLQIFIDDLNCNHNEKIECPQFFEKYLIEQ